MSKLSEIVNQLQMGASAVSNVLAKRVKEAAVREDAEVIRQMADNARDAANLLADVLEGVTAMESIQPAPAPRRQTVAEMLRGQATPLQPESEPEPDGSLGQQALDALIACDEAQKGFDQALKNWRAASAALTEARPGAKRAAQAQCDEAAQALAAAKDALDEADASRKFVLDSVANQTL